MRIAAQKVNNVGIGVSKSKMLDLTEKYTKQYGHCCEQLYDLGFLTTPSYFYEDEFWYAFLDEFPDYTDKFLNKHTGNMNFTLGQIQYVIGVTDDEEILNVLHILIDILEAKQALSDFGLFYSTAKFQKKTDILVCRTNLTVSNKVYSAGKVPLDSCYVQKCFDIWDKHIIKFDYTLMILKTLIKTLGLNLDLSLTDPSIFLGDNFTVKDDCKFLTQIINGEIEGSGKYAGLLHEIVEKYYDDYYTTRTTVAECVGFAEQNFINSIQSCIDYINEYRKSLPKNYKEVYVTASEVWFQLDEPAEKSQCNGKDIYIGMYLSDLSSKKPLGLIPRMMGYSGEFIYEYDPNLSKYKVSGMPVLMYIPRKQGGSTVPIGVNYYNVLSLKEDGRDVYPRTKFNEQKSMSVKEMLEFLEVDSLDTLHNEVADLITKSYGVHTYQFKLLVGMIVQTLCCMVCDYTLDGRKASNHLHIPVEYDWLTKEIYADACIEAEILFNKLGF